MSALARSLESYRRQPRPVRELIIALALVLAGLLLMPLGVYLVGQATLGPYARGGMSALLGDWFRSLFRGESAPWMLALGPLAVVLIWRLFRLALRST